MLGTQVRLQASFSTHKTLSFVGVRGAPLISTPAPSGSAVPLLASQPSLTIWNLAFDPLPPASLACPPTPHPN